MNYFQIRWGHSEQGWFLDPVTTAAPWVYLPGDANRNRFWKTGIEQQSVILITIPGNTHPPPHCVSCSQKSPLPTQMT